MPYSVLEIPKYSFTIPESIDFLTLCKNSIGKSFWLHPKDGYGKMGVGTQSRLEIKVMVSVGSYRKQQKLESLVTCKRKIFKTLRRGIVGP